MKTAQTKKHFGSPVRSRIFRIAIMPAVHNERTRYARPRMHQLILAWSNGPPLQLKQALC